MADRIKGITVEIGGNVKGLSKALGDVNKDIGSTKNQLKDVERLLKLDPGNTELLTQKQRLLAQAVEESKNKLKSLEDANDQVKASVKNYDVWKAKFDPINEKIGETETALKELKAQQAALGKENIDTAEYQALETKIKETNTRLKDLKQQAKDTSAEFGNPISQEQYEGLRRETIATKNELKRLEDQAGRSNVALNKISIEAGKVASVSGKVAGAMTPATAAIGGLGVVAFNAASDLAESQNKVDVAFGDSAGVVKDFSDAALESYGIAEGTAMDMAAQFGDMGTSMGLSKSAAADMSTSLVGLAGDLSSFKNISTDESMTALNGIFTGETESLKTLGVVMTQANLDAYALANGYGKTTAQMTEAEKVQLRYSYVLNATKNAQGDFANTSDGAANSTRIMQESLKEAASTFGEVLLPVITPIIQKITAMVQWLGSLDTAQQSVLLTILAIIAAIAPMAGLISGIATVVGTVSTAITFISGTILPALQTAFTTVFNFIAANPIVILTAAIVGLVALIAAKGDEIQAILAKVDDFLQGVFAADFTNIFGPVLGGIMNGFLDAFKIVWDTVKSVLDGVIDIIRGVFTGDWTRAWNGVKEVFSGVFNGLLSLAKAPLNGIIGLLNGAIRGINKLIDGFNSIGFDMPNWLGGGSWHPSIPNIPSIPMLAKGGNLMSGSAIVGEAGPELLSIINGGARVTPLSGNSTNNTTYGNTTINVYGAPGQDVNRLAEIVSRKINDSVDRKARVFG